MLSRKKSRNTTCLFLDMSNLCWIHAETSISCISVATIAMSIDTTIGNVGDLAFTTFKLFPFHNSSFQTTGYCLQFHNLNKKLFQTEPKWLFLIRFVLVPGEIKQMYWRLSRSLPNVTYPSLQLYINPSTTTPFMVHFCTNPTLYLQ